MIVLQITRLSTIKLQNNVFQGGDGMETDQMASSASEFQAIIKNIDSEISRLQTLIVGEDDKMIRYKVSYGPFYSCT